MVKIHRAVPIASLAAGLVITAACYPTRSASDANPRLRATTPVSRAQLATAVPEHACSRRIVTLPKQGASNGTVAVSQPPHGGAWAITQPDSGQSLVLHWNGRRWRVVERPYPRDELDDILALSSEDVWFAGGTGDSTGPLIEHWNGKRILVVRGALSASVVNYFGPLGGTRSNLWLLAVGGQDNQLSYLEHWNGHRWAKAKPPSYPPNNWVAIASRSPRDIWAVGVDIAHWNGSRWRNDPGHFSKGSGSGLGNDVLEFGPRDIWTIGETAIDHFDGTSWMTTPGHLRALASGAAIAGYARGPLYAAGYGDTGVQVDNILSNRGLLLHWKRGRWARVPVPLPKRPSRFTGVAVGRNGEVWVAGYTYRNYGNAGEGSYRPLMEHYFPCG